ncbi:MAG: hypothetical protein K6L81_01885 [Agarilytica sp.]
MPDWNFDPNLRLIVEPSNTGDTVYSVERDIYSAWKRWVQSGEGAGHPYAFIVEGGLPIGSTGLFTGKTQILINNWKLRGAGHDHQVTLLGNLYSDDGVVASPHTNAQVNFILNQSAAAQGISSGPSVEEFWRYTRA